MSTNKGNTTFISRLYLLLAKASEFGIDDVIAWHSSGRKFIIHKEEFTSKILSNIFNLSSFAIFTQKLKSYGFERDMSFTTENQQQVLVYAHANFRRDDPSFCQNITDRLPNQTTKTHFEAARKKSSLKALLSQCNNKAGYSLNELHSIGTSSLKASPSQHCKTAEYSSKEPQSDGSGSLKALLKQCNNRANHSSNEQYHNENDSLKALLGQCGKMAQHPSKEHHSNDTKNRISGIGSNEDPQRIFPLIMPQINQLARHHHLNPLSATRTSITTESNVVSLSSSSALVENSNQKPSEIVASVGLNSNSTSVSSILSTSSLNNEASYSSTKLQDMMISHKTLNPVPKVRSTWEKNILGSLITPPSKQQQQQQQPNSNKNSVKRKGANIDSAQGKRSCNKKKGTQWLDTLFENFDQP